MKTATLKRTGITLLLAGTAGLGITMTGMLRTYQTQAGDSATALAEGISGSLLPASIGSLLFLAGLIMVLLAWWYGRGTKHQTDFRVT